MTGSPELEPSVELVDSVIENVKCKLILSLSSAIPTLASLSS